jgi:LssY C-terminus
MQELTLDGKAAEAAYQKSLDTFSKRHHLRLWKQQQSGFWLGTATEDIGYKFPSNALDACHRSAH